MVQAVLFDLDGTLWDRDGAVRQLVHAQHTHFPELAHIPRDRYVDRVIELDAHGVGEKGAIYRQVVQEFALPAPLAGALLDHFWASYQQFYELYPEVLPTLRQLADQGLKLGIITNGNRVTQADKIRGLGLEPLMDTILISDREGVHKPDREIFNRALQRLGVPAAAAWFVGDHPEADVRGARDAGLTAVWRRSWSVAEHAHHVITSLDELLSLLPAPLSRAVRSSA